MENITSTIGICCLALSFTLKDKVFFPANPAYNASLESYFSVQETDIHPSCIVSPQTTQDVSDAVQILTKANESSSGCRFAIRSGGHAAFAGDANIEDGVTIDLSALDSIVLGQGVRPIVSVGPGATWGEVYSHLDAANLSVNGGRAGSIGVGGLTLGGGISYFGARFGWTCDTVTNLEVVLANGSIINANEDENTDLLWALRGGTNNFGIVTRIDLQTFNLGNLWGGVVVHPISTADEQIVALAAFTNPVGYDNFSALITSFVYSGAEGISVVVNNMEYSKPVVDPPAFQTIVSLPSLSSTQRITNVTDLVAETDMNDGRGFRQATATVTIQPTIEAINATVRAWNATVPLIQNISDIVWGVEMDVLPPGLYDQYARNNALGLSDQQGKSLIVVELTVAWSDAKDDDVVNLTVKALIANIQRDVGKLGALNPFVYINYAAPWQNPISSYGKASVDRLLKVQHQYDPRQVFTNLVPGGFKLPNTNVTHG